MLDTLGDRLRQLASADRLEGFSLPHIFAEVFRGRKEGEIDEYFVVGSDRTTPAIDDVQTGWPQPWFFMRVFAFLAVVYAVLYYTFYQFTNPTLVPGIMMMGALAVPLGTLFFFFELNTPRNVTFATTLMLVSLGGVASLFLALVGFKISNLGFLGDSDAGIVEEIGKLLAVVLVARQTKYKYILNGILFGAAIGCGFSVFETAGGYAFHEGFLKHAAGAPAELLANPAHADLARSIQSILVTQGYDGLLRVLPDLVKLGWNLGFAEMFTQIHYRSLLAPFGHIVWTAISAGAFWRVNAGGHADRADLSARDVHSHGAARRLEFTVDRARMDRPVAADGPGRDRLLRRVQPGAARPAAGARGTTRASAFDLPADAGVFDGQRPFSRA